MAEFLAEARRWAAGGVQPQTTSTGAVTPHEQTTTGLRKAVAPAIATAVDGDVVPRSALVAAELRAAEAEASCDAAARAIDALEARQRVAARDVEALRTSVAYDLDAALERERAAVVRADELSSLVAQLRLDNADLVRRVDDLLPLLHAAEADARNEADALRQSRRADVPTRARVSLESDEESLMGAASAHGNGNLRAPRGDVIVAADNARVHAEHCRSGQSPALADLQSELAALRTREVLLLEALVLQATGSLLPAARPADEAEALTTDRDAAGSPCMLDRDDGVSVLFSASDAHAHGAWVGGRNGPSRSRSRDDGDESSVADTAPTTAWRSPRVQRTSADVARAPGGAAADVAAPAWPVDSVLRSQFVATVAAAAAAAGLASLPARSGRSYPLPPAAPQRAEEAAVVGHRSRSRRATGAVGRDAGDANQVPAASASAGSAHASRPPTYLSELAGVPRPLVRGRRASLSDGGHGTTGADAIAAAAVAAISDAVADAEADGAPTRGRRSSRADSRRDSVDRSGRGAHTPPPKSPALLAATAEAATVALQLRLPAHAPPVASNPSARPRSARMRSARQRSRQSRDSEERARSQRQHRRESDDDTGGVGVVGGGARDVARGRTPRGAADGRVASARRRSQGDAVDSSRVVSVDRGGLAPASRQDDGAATDAALEAATSPRAGYHGPRQRQRQPGGVLGGGLSPSPGTASPAAPPAASPPARLPADSPTPRGGPLRWHVNGSPPSPGDATFVGELDALVRALHLRSSAPLPGRRSSVGVQATPPDDEALVGAADAPPPPPRDLSHPQSQPLPAPLPPPVGRPAATPAAPASGKATALLGRPTGAGPVRATRAGLTVSQPPAVSSPSVASARADRRDVDALLPSPPAQHSVVDGGGGGTASSGSGGDDGELLDGDPVPGMRALLRALVWASPAGAADLDGLAAALAHEDAHGVGRLTGAGLTRALAAFCPTLPAHELIAAMHLASARSVDWVDWVAGLAALRGHDP